MAVSAGVCYDPSRGREGQKRGDGEGEALEHGEYLHARLAVFITAI